LLLPQEAQILQSAGQLEEVSPLPGSQTPLPQSGGTAEGEGVTDGQGLTEGNGVTDGQGLTEGNGVTDGQGLTEGNGVTEGVPTTFLQSLGQVTGVSPAVGAHTPSPQTTMPQSKGQLSIVSPTRMSQKRSKLQEPQSCVHDIGVSPC